MENTGEGGGSFDASGAFHGTFSDDDDDFGERVRDRRGSRPRRVSEGNAPHPKPLVKQPPVLVKAAGTPNSKADRPLNEDKIKSSLDSSGKEDKDRRNLSPIRSPRVPGSPVQNKKQISAAAVAGSQPRHGDDKNKDKNVTTAVRQKEQAKNSEGLHDFFR